MSSYGIIHHFHTFTQASVCWEIASTFVKCIHSLPSRPPLWALWFWNSSSPALALLVSPAPPQPLLPTLCRWRSPERTSFEFGSCLCQMISFLFFSLVCIIETHQFALFAVDASWMIVLLKQMPILRHHRPRNNNEPSQAEGHRWKTMATTGGKETKND